MILIIKLTHVAYLFNNEKKMTSLIDLSSFFASTQQKKKTTSLVGLLSSFLGAQKQNKKRQQ